MNDSFIGFISSIILVVLWLLLTVMIADMNKEKKDVLKDLCVKDRVVKACKAL